jgi:hypothetical protein
MRKISFLALIILGILSFGLLSEVFGEMMTSSAVGVANGNVFRYNYKCYFNSNDPKAVPPASFSWINQTDYFMINVTGVSGSMIDFTTMLLGTNGSRSFGVCSMNVGTGFASISGYGGPADSSGFFFMTRNVSMMGRMYPSMVGSPTVNDTLMMNYMSGQRLANHFSRTTIQNGAAVNSDFYFDQATGMMVQWRQEAIQTSGVIQSNSTQMMKITESSVWVIPEFPISFTISVFIVIAVATLAVLGIAKLKRGLPQLVSL